MPFTGIVPASLSGVVQKSNASRKRIQIQVNPAHCVGCLISTSTGHLRTQSDDHSLEDIFSKILQDGSCLRTTWRRYRRQTDKADEKCNSRWERTNKYILLKKEIKRGKAGLAHSTKQGYEADWNRFLQQPFCWFRFGNKYVDLVSFGGVFVCSFLPFRNQQLSTLQSELNSKASEPRQ